MKVGVSGEEFAAALGVRPETFSRYETGRVEPKGETLEKMATFYAEVAKSERRNVMETISEHGAGITIGAGAIGPFLAREEDLIACFNELVAASKQGPLGNVLILRGRSIDSKGADAENRHAMFAALKSRGLAEGSTSWSKDEATGQEYARFFLTPAGEAFDERRSS